MVFGFLCLSSVIFHALQWQSKGGKSWFTNFSPKFKTSSKVKDAMFHNKEWILQNTFFQSIFAAGDVCWAMNSLAHWFQCTDQEIKVWKWTYGYSLKLGVSKAGSKGIINVYVQWEDWSFLFLFKHYFYYPFEKLSITQRGQDQVFPMGRHWGSPTHAGWSCQLPRVEETSGIS